MSEFVCWRNLLHPSLVTQIGFSTFPHTTLSADTSRINIPLFLDQETEIDLFEVYLASGASSTFRCRIVTTSTTTGHGTDTLAHANATATITASAAAWNVFNFTNFTLAAGLYWISLDSTATPSTALALHYNADYDHINNISSGRTVLFWTGSAYSATAATTRNLRARLKSATGWLCVHPLAPLAGASGIDGLIMDTLEDPACRGNRFVAPVGGKIIGFDVSSASFTAATSFDLVFASEGCTTELARAEDYAAPQAATQGIRRVRFPAVSVVAGTSYDVYITAGSQAKTTGGVGVTAIDTSEDGGDVIGCYGVTPGDIKGLSVHSPPTEGGADVPTTTLNHVFPWVPVYSEITTSGGGGSSRARARSF